MNNKILNRQNGLLLLSAVSLAGCGQKTAEQPNIIYVFPDQFRNCAMEFWNHVGYAEHVNFTADPVHTPCLNTFADEAVVFTSAQSNCPLSSPHRGILLTGMYPDGSGVPLNCNSSRPISSLRPEATCISDVFSANGYQCAYFGKLHVDFPTPNNPQKPGTYVDDCWPVWDAYTPKERRHGFEYWYSYGTFDVHKDPHYWDTEGQRHDPHEYSPKHEADQVIAFLRNKCDCKRPFFVMVSMNPPHSPYKSTEDCMEEDYALYKDQPLDSLLIRPNVNWTLDNKLPSAPYYFANVTGVDREFGRILDALKEMGLDKNTIVVFSSDHGETMCSHLWDPKNSPYTESMNVPFMVRYPKHLKPRVTDLLMSTPDIMPTLLGLAGLEKFIPEGVQGSNLSDYLYAENPVETSVKKPEEVLYLRNLDGDKDANGLVQNYFPVSRGIKTDRYTLTFTINRKTRQLASTLFFDDLNDPYQLNNLNINDYPEVVVDLCNRMAALLKQANDPWYREDILKEKIINCLATQTGRNKSCN